MRRLISSYKNNRIGHAYIVDGEKGTGKQELAYFFAKLLLCEHKQEYVPCETCLACSRVNSGNHPNITIIEPDGQSIKKEQIDQLILEMTKKGYEHGKKIYIIYEAHRMTNSSANTLLKYLEEPEGAVTAVLLTDAYQSMLTTIRSRCQRISLVPPSRLQIVEHLKNDGVTEAMAATVTLITANTEDAFTLAQDDAFAQRRKTVLKLVETLNDNVNEALLFIQSDWIRVFKERDETDQGLDLLLYALRDVVANKANLQEVSAYPDEEQLMKSLSIRVTYNQLSVMMETVLQAKRQLHSNMNRTLLMEQLVLNMQEGLLVV